MSIINKKELLRRTEDFTKGYMKNYDDSHNFEHVIRVKNMATKIAISENLSEEQIFIIQLAALTHDINILMIINTDILMKLKKIFLENSSII
jgi:HD superfamily phosphohydrolase YqeK